MSDDNKPIIRRRADGTFAKGQSGNPTGGRIAAQARLHKWIKVETKDGRELLEWALRVWRNRDDDGSPLNFTHNQRAQAFQWISDFYYGKAPHEIKVTSADSKPALDLSHYTTEELEELDRLHEAAQLRSMGVIDVPASDFSEGE